MDIEFRIMGHMGGNFRSIKNRNLLSFKHTTDRQSEDLSLFLESIQYCNLGSESRASLSGQIFIVVSARLNIQSVVFKWF